MWSLLVPAVAGLFSIFVILAEHYLNKSDSNEEMQKKRLDLYYEIYSSLNSFSDFDDVFKYLGTLNESVKTNINNTYFFLDPLSKRHLDSLMSYKKRGSKISPTSICFNRSLKGFCNSITNELSRLMKANGCPSIKGKILFTRFCLFMFLLSICYIFSNPMKNTVYQETSFIVFIFSAFAFGGVLFGFRSYIILPIIDSDLAVKIVHSAEKQRKNKKAPSSRR